MGRYYEEQTMSGIKAAVVARKYGISPSTVTQWVRDYREKHGEHAVR
jgi:transposase-like protein